MPFTIIVNGDHLAPEAGIHCFPLMGIDFMNKPTNSSTEAIIISD